MEKIILEFIDHMISSGHGPSRESDIIGDNHRRNYKCVDDKPNKKTCFYKLDIKGDFGYGYFGSYKTDEYFSFCSKSSKVYSREERNAFRMKAEKEQEEERTKREETHKQRARETREFLFFLEPCNEHPYLKKKGLPSGFGALHSGENLIIPMSDFDETWNYQRIKPDGEKLYFPDARKSGTWFYIPGDQETIYICEGFATGASVHMATDCAVLVAFDVGNIESVYKKVHEKYPDARFIFAADNDHEKKNNAGLLKAKQLKIKCGLDYRIPKFKNGTGLSDFNDLYVTEGLAAVRECLENSKHVTEQDKDEEEKVSASVEPSPNPAPDNNSWRENLILNKHGLVPNSTYNAALVIEHDDMLRGLFMFDSFSKEILIMRCPPWERPSDFRIRPVQDHDYSRLECHLEIEWGLKTTKNKCADLVESASMLHKNIFNPASDYFKSMKWDGTERLDRWLLDYVAGGHEKQSDEYLGLVGRKFMCGLAARAMYPGIKFDTMIILEGEQYAGKSSLARIMATVNGEEYFLDDFKDIENKDALMKMQGKLIVEFPEISTLRKAEINDLKAFISRQEDEYRPPYGRTIRRSPRQCVFVGTVNPEGPYFKDMTGNRRYWPISCRSRLDLVGLKNAMPYLHAEAAHLVRNGEKLYLTETEYNIAKGEQEKRCMFDLWTDRIESYVKNYNRVATDDICAHLELSMDKRSPIVFGRIQQIMASLGYKPTRYRESGSLKRGFIKQETLNLYENEPVENVSW